MMIILKEMYLYMVSLEKINIYDEDGKYLGVTSRDEVHQKGYWHETFHCWIINRESRGNYIHFQIRSNQKKDYPNVLDISAAGHLRAGEIVSEGVREVREELGLTIPFKKLIPLGIIKDKIIQENMIDKELGHVFLYITSDKLEEKYHFQTDEVSGMMKVECNTFCKLWNEKISEAEAERIFIGSDGEKKKIRKTIQKNHFLPHEDAYIKKVLALIEEKLSKERKEMKRQW